MIYIDNSTYQRVLFYAFKGRVSRDDKSPFVGSREWEVSNILIYIIIDYFDRIKLEFDCSSGQTTEKNL
jgi:hypothetical protein